MDRKDHILRVALPTPLRQTFDYLPPPHCAIEDLKIGVRIQIPFGKRQVIGVIVDVVAESHFPASKLKAAISILDNAPLFTDSILTLFRFASDYYQHPIGDVVFSSLPPLLREGGDTTLPEDIIYSLTELGANANNSTLKHATQQQKLIQLLRRHPNGLCKQELIEDSSQLKALTALLAKGFVRKHIRQQCGHISKKAVNYFALNEYQDSAVQAINKQAGFATFLLEGITGSGKTEVYLNCINHILEQNKQALILVPEIGLTPQTVARFQTRFTVPISILHSGLNDKERCYAWLSAARGIAKIIIGTRSAVLTPLPNLGIIILDEEHDASFKQQSGFRYSAKDLAIMRGKLESVPVILGSATPCLESLYNVKKSRFQHLILPKRAGNALEPQFNIIDVRNQKLIEGFSPAILEKMKLHLGNNGQVLIFLNRRGFAPTLLCHHCGWTANCPRCDAKFTYHADLDKLVCHHCASLHAINQQCRQCHGQDLLLLGLGTQRLEKALTKHFPNIPLVRIDRDSTRKKGSMEEILSNIHNGTSRILIGTQMLAKGHHFPDVTMVAIIDVDNSLYSSDFRASERLGQIIVQVAGRAGRSDRQGEVYLQTHNPSHPLLSHLLRSGYTHFAEYLLNERQIADLPPYSHMVLFRAEATNSILPQVFLSDVRQLLLDEDQPWQVFGPIPALMEKKAGKFRAHLLVQTKQRSLLQKILQPKIQAIENLPSGRKVRWSLDVDPIDLL